MDQRRAELGTEHNTQLKGTTLLLASLWSAVMTLYSLGARAEQQLVCPVPGDSVARHDTGNIQGQAVATMKGSVVLQYCIELETNLHEF